MIEKLERRFGKYAIRNLMYYIIILYAVGWVIQVFGGDFYQSYLSLSIPAIFRGQIWRLFTFIIYPPSTNIFYLLIGLYLYYSIGKTLEHQWGVFRFNLYFFTGVLLHILAALVCWVIFREDWGVVFGTYYLNFSLFFAFAATYPDMTFLLFFIIPIKAKWLGIINGVYFGVTILAGFFSGLLTMSMQMALMRAGIVAHPAYSIMALVSLGNFLIFFFGMRSMRRYTPKEIHRRRQYESRMKQGETAAAVHKCAICGRTKADDETLEFRYCSKCKGNYEYCQEHLFTHEHKQ